MGSGPSTTEILSRGNSTPRAPRWCASMCAVNAHRIRPSSYARRRCARRMTEWAGTNNAWTWALRPSPGQHAGHSPTTSPSRTCGTSPVGTSKILLIGRSRSPEHTPWGIYSHNPEGRITPWLILSIDQGRRSQRRCSVSPSNSSRRHNTLPGTAWLGWQVTASSCRSRDTC